MEVNKLFCRITDYPPSIFLRVLLLMEHHNLSPKEQLKETARIEAFSDGIFCVAITLLAIEIGVEFKQGETAEGLKNSLIHLWPKYLAYFISFVNILLAWVGHHSLFKNLRNTDNYLLFSNGLLLLLVALVPFPSKTLGLYFNTDAFQTAVIFYTGYFVLISIAFRLIWHAASRKKELLVAHITQTEIKAITKNENIGLIANVIITGLAFIQPWIALVLSFVMWVYWVMFA